MPCSKAGYLECPIFPQEGGHKAGCTSGRWSLFGNLQVIQYGWILKSLCLNEDKGHLNDDGYVKIITRGRFVASPQDMVPELHRIGRRLHWVHRGCAVYQKARIVCLRNQVHWRETGSVKQESPNIFFSRRLHYARHLPDLRMGFDRSASIRLKRCFATASQEYFVLA